MKFTHLVLSGVVLALCGVGVQAQSRPSAATAVSTESPSSAPLLQLSTSAQTEVPQDWLVMTLAVQKEGTQAAQVQKSLKEATTAAIAMARPVMKPVELEVSTAGMNVSARYGRDNKINGWSGSTQLVLQGTDLEQIGALAGRLPEFTVSQIEWALSPDVRRDAEMRIQAQAVDRFRARAQALARQFGFASYRIKDVRVGTDGADNQPVMRMGMAMAVMDSPPGSAPVPAVAGTARIVVIVAGSIELQ